LTITEGAQEWIFCEKKFPSTTPRKTVEQAFKEEGVKILDKLLPQLAQLHKEGQL
jgi:hypothetical protein